MNAGYPGSMNFLDRIRPAKEAEVAALRASPPRADRRRIIRSLHAALSQPDLAVIAEVKRRAPSVGSLAEAADPVAVARAYERAGAAAISVLTDGPHFGGSLADLAAVSAAVDLPVLRKDFLIDPLQVAEAAVHGADAVLLIVAMLDDAQLAELSAAVTELGLEALVETHTAEEVERALAAGARIVGVNNRDLESLAIDLATGEALLPTLRAAGVVAIGESGVHGPAEARRLRTAGADAILVGSALMAAPDPGALVEELRACG